jgi:hypothetical protein
MGKRKKKSMKIRSSRSAGKIKERYERSVSKGKEGRLGKLDKLFEDLQKYQTKTGLPSKSKLRSNKAKEDYNRLLKEIEKLGTFKKRNTERIDETAAVVAKNFNIEGKNAAAAAEVFVSNTLPEIPGFSTSEAVLALADSGFDADSIYKILNYLKDDINMSTPDEMKHFAEEDDMNMFITHVCNLHELAPDIPNGDIILMAQQMVDYDMNDYESTIDEYYAEQEEEEDEDY